MQLFQVGLGADKFRQNVLPDFCVLRQPGFVNTQVKVRKSGGRRAAAQTLYKWFGFLHALSYVHDTQPLKFLVVADRSTCKPLHRKTGRFVLDVCDVIQV